MTTARILPLTRQNMRESLDLAARVFVADSPLHAALGLDVDAYRDHLETNFTSMVGEGLSVVALDDSERVTGCMICTEVAAPVGTGARDERFAPITALCDALLAGYTGPKGAEPGRAMLVDMGLVAPTARGQGIYGAMRRAVHEIARDRGFSVVLGELSSATTQHVVLGKLGHRKVAEIAYRDFRFGGERPFAGITAPPSIILSEGLL